ncbi:hypothetical protein Pla110_33480 [Polystyrenella longa]|uniref:THUMP-like domain-containing protein n=1 Tax=Polystyrenella longa TaxID=2528007 RepID=A0A518CQV0_9PLAN|nr:hypothetical protein [Polystyrenella longa]QDU81606.1 hypothetical protein Pla110_33480 [Polystyrenella longa]
MNIPADQESHEQLDLWKELRRTPEILKQLAHSTSSELRLQQDLRKDYPPHLVRTAITLHELREKGAKKFSRASEMWFDRIGLEQATPEAVAFYKASQFAERIQQDEIHDYCTGIGGDAVALASRGPVHTYDLAPLHAWQAEENAACYGFGQQLTAHTEDVTRIDHSGKWVHLDPDRRSSKTRSRTMRLEQYEPGLEFMQQLVQTARGGALKLSPASNFYGKFPGAEIELISLGGECKEATIWFGELAEPGLHRATSLPAGESLVGSPLSTLPAFDELQTYLYDPDPAVVRASLIDLLSERLGLARLDEEEEYLTSEEYVDSPFVSGFEVQEVLPNNLKLLKKYFQQHPAGQVEIKSRHLPTDATAIRKRLPLTGSDPVTLIFARVQSKAHIIVCRRV